MVNAVAGLDDRCMTTEQPTAPRVLRRRSDDRVIGGVASGIGDFLNVDPLLIRIAFVGLMVFGGLGFLLYVGAWLLVPDDATDKSVLEHVVQGSGRMRNPWLRAIVLVVGALIAASVLTNVLFGVRTDLGTGIPTSDSGFFGVLTIALVIVLLGTVILRRSDPTDPVVAATAASNTAASSTADAAVPPTQAVAAAPRPRRRRRPASPLGWYILGAVLVAVGALALLTNVTDVSVQLAQYFGLALAVLGVGLVVGTWWGHARTLILLGLLILPFAVMASYVTVPLEGGIGEQRYTPMDAGELQDEYRLTGGQLVLDLTEVELTAPIEVAASVAMGELVVLLPAEVSGEVDATVGAGNFYILGASQSGTQLEDRFVLDGTGPDVTLALDTGVGTIRVFREGSQGR
jgi:phage shock protein PspC (stress-responsive transcriptional regulator)